MKIEKGEMSEKQAARIIEMYDNAMRNGESWAHDVFLHRGTEKYAKSLTTLNEAFDVKSIPMVVKPLASGEKVSPGPNSGPRLPRKDRQR
jgi:hypothetical protein